MFGSKRTILFIDTFGILSEVFKMYLKTINSKITKQKRSEPTIRAHFSRMDLKFIFLLTLNRTLLNSK